MIPAKTFDCVEMKNRIQARLDEQYRGLTDDEIWECIKSKAATSESPVWKWWREMQKADKQQRRNAASVR